MIYIQRKDDFGLETIDQCNTMKEAKSLLHEYRLSDNNANYYTSSRACKGWIDWSLCSFNGATLILGTERKIELQG